MPSKYPTLEHAWAAWAFAMHEGDPSCGDVLTVMWVGLKATLTPAQVVELAKRIGLQRGGVGFDPLHPHEVVQFIKLYPGEYATVDGWLRGTPDRAFGQPMADSPATQYHCERLVLAFLLGHHVSADVHQLCNACGLASLHSEMSMPLVGPYAPTTDKPLLQMIADSVRVAG